MEIKGRVAIVTGGASGIGRIMAQKLAQLGARVVVADRNLAGAEETVALLTGKGVAHQVDVSTPHGAQELVNFTLKTFGKLDILHNNAGLLSNSEDFLSTPPERLAAVVSTNLAGLMLVTQAAARAMKAHGGCILNTASVSGLRPWPLDPIYSASKAGVVFFTRAVSEELKHYKIRVNAICPGLVRTPMAAAAPRIQVLPPDQRAKVDEMMVSPEEVVEALLEFILDDSLHGEARFFGKSGLPPEGKMIKGL